MKQVQNIFYKYKTRPSTILTYYAQLNKRGNCLSQKTSARNFKEIVYCKLFHNKFQSKTMSNSVIRIGNYSYFPAQILGQGATGSVFMGKIHK